jgi:hypothetical protein
VGQVAAVFAVAAAAAVLVLAALPSSLRPERVTTDKITDKIMVRGSRKASLIHSPPAQRMSTASICRDDCVKVLREAEETRLFGT